MNNSEQYIRFYDKFWLRSFDEIIGNQETKKLMMNGIQAGMLHRTIVTGEYGRGKTRTNNLIVAANVCLERGDTYNPCLKCEECDDFNRELHPTSAIFLRGNELNKSALREIKRIAEAYRGPFGKIILMIEDLHDADKSFLRGLRDYLDHDERLSLHATAIDVGENIPIYITERCLVFEMKTPNTKECLEYSREICDKLRITIESDEAANNLIRVAKNNIRTILTAFEIAKISDLNIGKELLRDQTFQSNIGAFKGEVMFEPDDD